MTKYKLGEIIELNPRESIKKGNIAASPLVNEYGSGPCDYCDYVGICRCDGLYRLKSLRVQKKMDFDELLNRTKK